MTAPLQISNPPDPSPKDDYGKLVVVVLVFVLIGAAAGHLYINLFTRPAAGGNRDDADTRRVRQMAGYSELSGSGVVVELKDAVREREQTKTLIIHDTDLLNLINELRAAGAKGLSLASGGRERRLTALTPVRCVGPTVVVGDTRLASPFRIRAVGDPKVLQNSILMQGGAVENLREFGIDVEVHQEDDLTLPSAPGSELE